MAKQPRGQRVKLTPEEREEIQSLGTKPDDYRPPDTPAPRPSWLGEEEPPTASQQRDPRGRFLPRPWTDEDEERALRDAQGRFVSQRDVDRFYGLAPDSPGVAAQAPPASPAPLPEAYGLAPDTPATQAPQSPQPPAVSLPPGSMVVVGAGMANLPPPDPGALLAAPGIQMQMAPPDPQGLLASSGVPAPATPAPSADQTDRLQELGARFRSGTISPEEEAEFDQLLAADAGPPPPAPPPLPASGPPSIAPEPEEAPPPPEPPEQPVSPPPQRPGQHGLDALLARFGGPQQGPVEPSPDLAAVAPDSGSAVYVEDEVATAPGKGKKQDGQTEEGFRDFLGRFLGQAQQVDYTPPPPVYGEEDLAQIAAAPTPAGQFTVPAADPSLGSISVACPFCSRPLVVPAAYAGQLMNCPYCAGKIAAVDPSTATQGEAAAVPEPAPPSPEPHPPGSGPPTLGEEVPEPAPPQPPEIAQQEGSAEPPSPQLPETGEAPEPPTPDTPQASLDAMRRELEQLTPEEREQALEGVKRAEEALAPPPMYGEAGAARRRSGRGRLGMRAARFLGVDAPIRGAMGLYRDVRDAFSPDSATEREAAGIPGGGTPGGGPGLDELRQIRALLEEMVRNQTGDGSALAERNRAESTPGASAPAGTGTEDKPEAENPTGGGVLEELGKVLGLRGGRGAGAGGGAGGGMPVPPVPGGPMRPGVPVPPPGAGAPVPGGGVPGAPAPGGGGWGRVAGRVWDGVRMAWRLIVR